MANGRANIMLYSINSDGPGFRAIIAGAVGDYGPAVTVDPDGKVDAEHGSEEIELNLTRGSFRLSIAGLDKKFVAAASHEPIYPATCSDLLTRHRGRPDRGGLGHRRVPWHQRQLLRDRHAAMRSRRRRPARPPAFLWQAIIVSGPGTVSVG